MMGSDKRVRLRHDLEPGMNQGVIARQLGVRWRTVCEWVERGPLNRARKEEPVKHGSRRSVRSKLDPYQAIIDARRAADPKLTASRLFREVRKAGWPGGYGEVKRSVRRARPRAPQEPVQRFETPPGHQASVDFADFRFLWGQR